MKSGKSSLSIGIWHIISEKGLLTQTSNYLKSLPVNNMFICSVVRVQEKQSVLSGLYIRTEFLPAHEYKYPTLFANITTYLTLQGNVHFFNNLFCLYNLGH